MEFANKEVDDRYSDLCAEEEEIESELEKVRAKIKEIVDNEERA